jgi:HNH endonuclease
MMNLKHLTDKTLLADLKVLVARERELSTKVLHHLKEIDRRKLYSDLGYTSLFDYCLKELKYSEAAAARRIRAARTLTELPEIVIKIENGNLNLSNLNQALVFFKQNEIDDKKEKLEILEKLENLSKAECTNELLRISGNNTPPPSNTIKKISNEYVRFNISLKEATAENFKELQTLFGHQRSMSSYFDFLIYSGRIELEKKKFNLHKDSRKSHPPVVVTRVIPASIKKEVYLRDQKCIKCGSLHNLQFDHQLPFALGGDSSSKNIRILCFNCNQRAKIRAKL